ncbi:hypothetical protein C1645_829596 [Glomus cerebriforme]|uniref:DUF7431 domain-containing protein n=1 Tax=Glomus cerebriforme TaxID=658196 RepID=A0A397SQL3_9GLOM|nr:hypothetical protein C1645_829596 [Glomus cerebriforme]
MVFNFKNFLYYIDNDEKIPITVKTISDSLQVPEKSVLLRCSDNLLVIRQELEKNYDNLLFLRRYSQNNIDSQSHGFAEIACQDEEVIHLDEIVDGDIIYIKCKIRIDLNFLNEKCKLDYGCTMTFDEIKKANKRAFEMKNCEMNEINSYEKGVVEFKTNEERIMKTNLFFSADVNVENFLKLGVSIKSMKDKKSNSETSGSYHFMKHAKLSLKFTEYLKCLEPTSEFTEAVKNAIDSEDPPENFKQITKEFGQFIPTEIILGGRAHFKEHIISTGNFAGNSKEIAMNTNAKGAEVVVASTSNCLKGKSTYHKFNCTKLIGGGSPNSLENFNEADWVKSLKENYENWDCIEFRDPISIFQILPDSLHKQIIKSIGKTIHYSTTEEFCHQLDQPEEFGKPKIFELNMPPDVLKIVKNKDADCNIFATVIDTTESKNDFFTCQVLCPPNGKPNLIIHCVQKRFKRHECKLKIGWMVIGYVTDFNLIFSDFNAQLEILKNENVLNNQTMINTDLLNFKYNPYVRKVPPCLGIPVLTKLDSSNDSLIIGHHFYNAHEENQIGAYTFSYCLKNNHFVNLPNFIFCTLIISNYHNSNAYDVISFDYPILKKKKPYIDLTAGSCRFISLYSTHKANCGPIFLKQNCKRIKAKSIECKNTTCYICKNNTLRKSDNNIRCAFFDPYQKMYNLNKYLL